MRSGQSTACTSRIHQGRTETNETREEEDLKRNFRKYFGTGILGIGLLLAAGIPAFAKNFGIATLLHDASLHGKPLRAGTYAVEWKTHSPQATVQFSQRFKVSLFAEGRVERRAKKYEQNAVVYDTAPDGSLFISEIRFANSNRVLVFD